MTRSDKQNPRIKPPDRLSKGDIRKKTEEFRRQYIEPVDSVPVPVEEVLELDLNIEVVPIGNLKKRLDIIGCLSKDAKTLYVDKDSMMDERRKARYRFTIAHETGHYYMHRKIMADSEFDSINDWIEYRSTMSEDNLDWFEWQASEFAGRLLVPKDRLVKELNDIENKIERAYRDIGEKHHKRIKECIAREIYKTFEVSPVVIEKRIRYEEISLREIIASG